MKFAEAVATMRELGQDATFSKRRQAAAIARAASDDDESKPRKDTKMSFDEAVAKMWDAATDPDEPAEERRKAKAALRKMLGEDDDERDERRDGDDGARARALGGLNASQSAEIDRIMKTYRPRPFTLGGADPEAARAHLARRQAEGWK